MERFNVKNFEVTKKHLIKISKKTVVLENLEIKGKGKYQR
jgi:hypothetical protein